MLYILISQLMPCKKIHLWQLISSFFILLIIFFYIYLCYDCFEFFVTFYYYCEFFTEVIFIYINMLW